jgi:hypothetical protein
MAAAQIVRLIIKLIGKQGLVKGVQLAKKLGFKNKDIQKAIVTQKQRLQSMRKAAEREIVGNQGVGYQNSGLPGPHSPRWRRHKKILDEQKRRITQADIDDLPF